MNSDLTILPSSRESIAVIAWGCRQRVKRCALVSAGAALMPLPGLDIATDVTVLTHLINDINGAFGLTPQQIEKLEANSQARLYQAIVAFGGALIGKIVTQEVVLRTLCSVGARLTVKQAARYLPIAGQALSAALGYGAMRYVGERHIRDCVRVLEEFVAVRDMTVTIDGIAERVDA